MDIGDDHPRIMIIDDEQVVLESCTEILLDRPYEIATATSGKSGLDLVDGFRPDLIFVDLKMPGISGLEVLETVNRDDPTIVTVVITGYATVDSALEAMKLGAYDFIPKPFTPDQFRVVTDRALEKRKLVVETIALRREKEMLRENFAAIVSHELKSPLSAVQQNLFVLSHQLTPVITEDQCERLERMKARIGDLIGLVDTWLRGVTVDLSAIRDWFRVISVSGFIARAAESVQPHAVRKNVALVVDEHGESVFGDEGTLAEAFTNIVGNAVKYSYEGGTVTVSTKQLDDQVRFDVTDTGIGISEDDQARIFDDFFRAESGADQATGAGLGLAISRRIIAIHGGSVSVESKAGAGTTFTVLLPTKEIPQPDTSTSESSEN